MHDNEIRFILYYKTKADDLIIFIEAVMFLVQRDGNKLITILYNIRQKELVHLHS
jgi:hypothetical protein